MYKVVQINKEEYKKCEVEIIDKEKCFWVNRKSLEVESDVANQAQIFDKCDKKTTKIQTRTKSCRKSSKRFLELKNKVRIRP